MDVTGLSLSRYSRVVSASSELRSSRLDGIANHLSLTERLSNSDESVDVHPVDAVSDQGSDHPEGGDDPTLPGLRHLGPQEHRQDAAKTMVERAG